MSTLAALLLAVYVAGLLHFLDTVVRSDDARGMVREHATIGVAVIAAVLLLWPLTLAAVFVLGAVAFVTGRRARRPL